MENLERERGAIKAFSRELFDSVIAEFKKGLKNVRFKEKSFKANWWSKLKCFFEKPRNQSIPTIHFST